MSKKLKLSGSVSCDSVTWHTGRDRRTDAFDGGAKNSRVADTGGRQVARERREVERKRRFVAGL